MERVSKRKTNRKSGTSFTKEGRYVKTRKDNSSSIKFVKVNPEIASQKKLVLIPTINANNGNPDYIAPIIKKYITECDAIFVENAKTARLHIKNLQIDKPIQDLNLIEYENRFTARSIDFITDILNKYDSIGVMSESGLPCVADPGNIIVQQAHKFGIKVIPLPGPSAIYQTLMASGFNGQNFAFVGYLPVDRDERINKIYEYSVLSSKLHMTFLSIETPYRAKYLYRDLINTLPSGSKLCLGINISLPDEQIVVSEVENWDRLIDANYLDDKLVVFCWFCKGKSGFISRDDKNRTYRNDETNITSNTFESRKFDTSHNNYRDTDRITKSLYYKGRATSGLPKRYSKGDSGK